MQYIKIIILFLFFSSIAACNMITGIGTDNAPAPTPLTNIAHPCLSPQLVIFKKDLGVGTDGAYLKLNSALNNHHLYTVDAKGQVCAFDTQSGRTLWCKETKAPAVTGVGVHEGVIAFATRNSKLYVLCEQNGEVLWTASLPNQSLAAPTIANNKIFVKTIDGNVCAFDKTSGNLIWKYEHATPVFILRDSSSPQVMGNYLVVGFADGKLAAYHLQTGELVWEQTIATPAGRGLMSQLVDVSADPTMQQGTVYVVTYQGNLAAVDLTTGKKRWEQPLSSYTGMAITPNAVIVTDEDGIVWAFNKTNGHELWKQEKLKYRTLTAPALQGCYVVVADRIGYLHWLSTANGEFAARRKIAEEPILTPPIVDGNEVGVVTQKGTWVVYSI